METKLHDPKHRPPCGTKRFIHCRLATAGLIGLGVLCYQHAALAADTGSQQGTNITVNDGDRITADARDGYGNLYGVLNPWGATGTINLGTDVTVQASDPDGLAQGVVIQGNESHLIADQLNVNVSGEVARGLTLYGRKSQANLGTGSRIEVSGTGKVAASGIEMDSASGLTADQLTIQTHGENGIGVKINDYGTHADLGSGSVIKTSGRISYGVYIDGLNGNSADGPAKFTADQLTIETEGASAFGMNIQEGAVVDLGSHSRISTDGDDASGIWSFGDIKANALTVSTRGEGANGIEIRGGSAVIGAGSHVSSESGGALVANGKNASIDYTGTADNRNSLFSGGQYGASAQGATSAINLRNTDITIDHNGELALGLWALGGGKITGKNIRISGAAGTRGVYAMTNSQIDLTGDLDITMADVSQLAIATQHNEGYDPSRINATGKMNIYGGIESRGGLININMDPGSVWTGHAFSDNVNGGELNVALNESRWNVTGHSELDNLTLNNGVVDFAGAPLTDENSTLRVGNLSGNGEFILRTDIVGEGDGVNNSGDRLVVTGTSSGNHSLTILNRGSMDTTGNEILTVVETTDAKARGTGFTATSLTELGGYLYDVRQNGNNWELFAAGSQPEPTPEPDPEPTPDPTPEPDPLPVPEPDPQPTPQPDPQPAPTPKPDPTPVPPITTTADAGGNFLNVGYLLSRAENQTLLQRMGDLRQGSSEQGHAWIRGFGGRFDAFAGGKMSGFKLDYSGTQLGFDKRFVPEVPFYTGVFMGLTQGSPDYRSGNGTVQSHHAGLYATYMADNGFYTDAIVKASRMKNSFSVQDSQDNTVAGSGNGSGFSVSLEAGQKFSLSRFYIEPQMQVSYTHQNAARLKASNGLNISLSSYESLTGRTSILTGYETATDNSQINIWLKTGLTREFKGGAAYTLNRSREAHSFKGNDWSNGLGVSASLNKTHTLYLEADYVTGHSFRQRQINGGYRFSF